MDKTIPLQIGAFAQVTDFVHPTRAMADTNSTSSPEKNPLETQLLEDAIDDDQLKESDDIVHADLP
jgi:hypothetical protein